MVQPAFLHAFVTRSHKGIYGIIRRNGQILVIRKARGPYTGLYDLPGGSPEAGETPEQTLVREIKEETNCDVTAYENKREKTIFFSQFTKASGETGCMQHTGVLFDVHVSGEPTATGDGLDSNGAVWMNTDDLSEQNATPFVLMGCGKNVISLANEAGCPMDIAMRGRPYPTDRYPMIAAVLLFNTKGNIILQKTALTQKNDPGKWNYSAAGHIDAGESYEQAALRELQEEMGIRAKTLSFIGQCRSLKAGKPHAFHRVFKVVSDAPVLPDAAEVSETVEWTIPQLKTMLQEHPEQFRDVFSGLLHTEWDKICDALK